MTSPTTPTMREALAELVACHTESAGWSMSMLKDRAEFDQMLARSQERVEAAVNAARAALAADDAARGTMREQFEAWWATEGQFVRSGGGDYEKCFAFAAWERQASRAAVPQSVEPVAWGQLGTLNGRSYLRQNYDRTPYPPPPDVARNLNLVPLYAAPPAAPTDAEWQAENERLRVALRFYARGEHYNLDESEEFDTVSGEPENWLCSGLDDSATMIENGRVALFALRGIETNWIDGDEDCTPQPVEGEKALRPHIATRPAPTKTKEQP